MYKSLALNVFSLLACMFFYSYFQTFLDIFYYFCYFKQSIKIEDTYLKIFCQGFCKNLINDFVFVKHVRYFQEKCGVPRETILTNLYLGVRKY